MSIDGIYRLIVAGRRFRTPPKHRGVRRDAEREGQHRDLFLERRTALRVRGKRRFAGVALPIARTALA